MTEKATSEELEKRIQDLEQAEFECIQSEKGSQESNEKYRLFLNNIQAAVVVHSADTNIIASNTKAQELLGLTEAQMLGRRAIDPGWKFCNADNNKMPFEQYPVNQVLSTQQVLRNLTLSIYRPDTADSVWVLVNADPVFNEKRDIKQVIVTFMDITGRKQAEEILRESEQSLKRAQRITKTGSWYYDWNSATEVWSDECFKLYGLKKKDYPDNIVPESFSEKVYENSKEIQDLSTSLSEKHNTYELEFKTTPINGKIKTIHSYCEVEKDNNGNILKVFGTDQDITERKQMEKKLGKYRDNLEEMVEQRTVELLQEITEHKRTEKEREKLIKKLQVAVENIKTLSGLLPICCNCKKIRDDKGYWNQIESYLQEHSEAKFSHSICQECAKKYYPDFDVDDD
jgi:PAS domain S-box-containing protein